eukprot:6647427-Pyramimonas_sp.AAC.1
MASIMMQMPMANAKAIKTVTASKRSAMLGAPVRSKAVVRTMARNKLVVNAGQAVDPWADNPPKK